MCALGQTNTAPAHTVHGCIELRNRLPFFPQGARTLFWTNLTPDHNQDVYFLIANCKCCIDIVDSQGGALYLYYKHISLLLCVQ